MLLLTSARLPLEDDLQHADHTYTPDYVVTVEAPRLGPCPDSGITTSVRQNRETTAS